MVRQAHHRLVTGIVYFENIRLYKEFPPPEHSATVDYDGYPEYISEPRWHVWNIPLAEFNDVNLGNVAKIAIGFGDWTSPGGEPNGYGAVYFEDIILRKGPAEDIYYDGSVYLAQDPFENGYQNWPLLLKQDCRLIDGGGDYIDGKQYLIGKTTAWKGFPDSNIADIGFHYFNWYYVNAWDSDSSFADLDDNNTIDLRDFAILANDWGTTYDINDLKIMADKWLWVKLMPNVIPSFDGDPNNLSGYVQMSIPIPDPNIYRVFALIDGKFYREFFLSRQPLRNPEIRIWTQLFTNGFHKIKIVSVDYDLNIICSEVNEVLFNNDISNIAMTKAYKLDSDFYLYAFSDSSSTSYTVEIVDKSPDNNGITVFFSNSFTGDIKADIPPETFEDDIQFYELVVKDSASGDVKFRKFFGKDWDFDKSASLTYDPNIVMVLSIGSAVLETDCNSIIKVIRDSSRNKFGANRVRILTYPHSTWDEVFCALCAQCVKIWVHFGHGRPYIDSWLHPIPYQGIEFNGEMVGVFPNKMDRNYLTDLGFYEGGLLEHKLSCVYLHCCFGAQTTQFSDALGITVNGEIPLDEQPGERGFLSWNSVAWYGENNEKYHTIFPSYNKYTRLLFNSLIACGRNLHEARQDVAEPINGIIDADEISSHLCLLGVSSDQKFYFNTDITTPDF
jgi:hypothetical protein